MGFMDELRKLTQPYEDDDDFFDGAEKPRTPSAPPAASSAQAEFESTFGGDNMPSTPRPAPRERDEEESESAGSLFGNLGGRKPRPAQRERLVNLGGGGGGNSGGDSQVILFSPKTFDDAKDLVGYLQLRRSVVMTLESLPTDQARRMLDLCSGIALALQGKITPVSAKTFFVTPISVDIVGSQAPALESDGEYF